MANSRKRVKEFVEGDYVMIRLRPEWFPLGTVKKLYARGAGPFKVIKKVGPNAYVLELPPKFGIRSTFNISDLVEYRELAMIPSEPFGLDPILESEPIPECPPLNSPWKGERIKHILDDQVITTLSKGY